MLPFLDMHSKSRMNLVPRSLTRRLGTTGHVSLLFLI
jgi:hypothetical protein